MEEKSYTSTRIDRELLEEIKEHCYSQKPRLTIKQFIEHASRYQLTIANIKEVKKDQKN